MPTIPWLVPKEAVKSSQLRVLAVEGQCMRPPSAPRTTVNERGELDKFVRKWATFWRVVSTAGRHQMYSVEHTVAGEYKEVQVTWISQYDHESLAVTTDRLEALTTFKNQRGS